MPEGNVFLQVHSQCNLNKQSNQFCMKTLFLLALALLSPGLKATPTTFTLSYATTINISCAVGDTLKFYGNGNDHYIVNVNSATVVNSTSVPTAPYYIGKYVVTSADTSYTIGRMSQGMRSGKITVINATSIFEPAASSNMNAYPNPVASLLTVTATADQQAEILSAEGKPLMTAEVRKGANTIDLSPLPKGMYFIRLNGRTGKIIRE
jgi:hypothetical protein